MTTKNDVPAADTRVRVMGPLRGVLLLSALFCSSCGAQVDAGNSGSETHWLSACDSDQQCGEFSCLCGRCSVACDDSAECEEHGKPVGECTTPARLASPEQCGSEPKERICARQSDLSAPVEPEPEAEPEPSVPAPPPGPICDGSDAIRVVHRDSGGGPLSPGQAFLTAYGWSFLAIDGRCNYWVSTELGHVHEGTITDPAVLEPYESTVFGRLANLQDVTVVGCPDASATVLWDPYGVVNAFASCGSRELPEDWRDAFDRATELRTSLFDAGQRSQGALRLLLSATEASSGPGSVSDWPLSMDPAVALDTLDFAPPFARYGVGALFGPGPDADTLRAAETADASGTGRFEYPTSPGETATLLVTMRDELPSRVLGALDAASEAAYADPLAVGEMCDDAAVCVGLQCSLARDTAESACTTCIGPDDAQWACQSNADCCEGLVCCVDCGDNSGRCLPDPDPCQPCLESGSAWLPGSRQCSTAECVPDTQCFTAECPEPCATDNCGGCFTPGECWAAGCGWSDVDEASSCVALSPAEPGPEQQAEPCAVDASDPSLPGVTIHLEADTCVFEQGQGGQFRYTVELEQALDFSATSGGTCGLCFDPLSPDTWIDFTLDGADASYCPACDIGCCPPTDPMPATLAPQTTSGSVDWPGLQWNGPSDLNIPPSGAFPPGDYTASVSIALPDLGEVTARLPVQVVAAP